MTPQGGVFPLPRPSEALLGAPRPLPGASRTHPGYSCAWCEAHFPPTLHDWLGWHHFHTDAPCWWFVHQVYRRHLQIVLPKHEVIETRDQWSSLVTAHMTQFQRADPDTYRLVLFCYPNGTMHVGIMENARWFLHVPTPEAGVCRAELMRYQERGYLRGIYRYIG